MSSSKGWVSALILVLIAFVAGCPEEEGSEGIGRLGVRSLCEQTGDPFWCELLGIPTGPGQALPDTDGDGIIDAVDNCPATANPDQSDCDGDLVGDACAGEPDCNGNNIPDSCDIAAASVRAARAGARDASIDRGNAPIEVLWWDSTPEYGGQAADALRQAMSDFLDSFDGGTVFNSTYVSSEVPGTLATHMLSNSYDVIVFDATSGGTKFNADDLVAVQAHFLNHPSVLLDGILYIRSIISNDTSVFPGVNGSSGGFTANEVYQLGVRGGGIMVGTDHQGFQVDANQIVDAIVPGAAFTGNTVPSLDGQFNGDDLLDAVAIVSPFDLFAHWSSIPTEGIAPTGDFTDFFGRSVTLSSQLDVADAPGGGPRFSYIATSWSPQGTAPEFDCNGNGILDGIDIAGGTSADCDANFVPDECDPDCNGNSEPDGCEIIDDAALDCDGNDTMDECEIGQDSVLDGNGNGVLDVCESVEIFSADCNGNGVPDECEADCNGDQTPDDCPAELEPGQDCNGNDLPDCHDIAGGTSRDCNGNSIPDECDIVDGQVRAGAIFLTGHDPDFHASLGGNAAGARNISSAAINFVMNPVFNPFVDAGASKFLFVEAKIVAPGGHTNGVNGIVAGGYGDGVDFDHHDASTLGGALNDLGSVYGAIVVASDFGGVLTQAELDILNARSADIIGFLNQGGGLYAMSESNGGVGLTPDGGHYAFLPFVVSSTAFDQTEVGLAVTDFGSSLGLTNADVNGNASHAIFVEESGLSIVDVDPAGNILSLAARGVFDPDAGLVTDCNENQVPDECDIAEGTSNDCNGNDTPDDCELGEPPTHDCCETGHGAGCSDAEVEACVCAGDAFCCSGEWDSDCAAEVESFGCGLCGPAKDCNGNLTLDECDVASGTSADCNANGTPDECDLAGGTGDDCNGNDFLDACDIETGTSQDCNGNSVPDACDVAGIAAIRISQESAAGAGDFDQNVLGFLQPFETTLSAFDYYRYSLGSAASFNGTEPMLTAERSHLFLVQATDGLSLFVVHDIPGNADGGSANTHYELSGDPDGVFRSAEDDPGEGYSGAPGESVFAANHSWSACCTDGLALTGLDGNWSMLVDFTTSVSGLNSWAAYAPGADPIALDLAPNRRVRLDVSVRADASDCNGNSIPDECDVESGDADDSDGDQVLDECEGCPLEPALLQPQDTFETDCGDGIDNDCDGLTDLSDGDCE